MDLDALHRNVTRLMKFMERVESQKVMGDQDAPPLDAAQVAELRDKVKAFAERLDAADLANLSDRLGAMATELEAAREQLAALDAYKTEIVQPALHDVSEMVSWFQANKENLEGAIMLADAMDEEPATPVPAPNPTEQGAEASQGATGESSAAPAPEDAAGTDASQAAS